MLYTLQGATPEALASIEEEKRLRKTDELFLLFTLGSQFDFLIYQALAKLGVYCLVADPGSVVADDVVAIGPKGIILSGGPVSVAVDPPPFDRRIFDLNIPVLGICLGFQLWAKHIGVRVAAADKREFGVHQAHVRFPYIPLVKGCPTEMKVLQSHGDRVEPDPRLTVIMATDNTPVAAASFRNLHGVQFHPEVPETEYGSRILENFCFNVCGARDRFPAQDTANQKILDLKQKIGHSKVLLALSGGSDSSTVAYLLKAAMTEHPGNLRGVYILGIDRPDDEAHVLKFFGGQDWLDLKVVDATEEFLTALSGKLSGRDKRLAVRQVYRRVLEDEIVAFGDAGFIAQGTLYTDLSESGMGHTTQARKAVIKIHHNTGLNFSVPELTPLDDCVKDGGRSIGRSIGVPEELLTRHPFPGPGLVVRIEPEVTAETLRIARAVDGIWIEELRRWGYYDKVWQAAAFVSASFTTCTKGDDAGLGRVIVLRAVNSVHGFTATRSRFEDDFLDHVDRRICNEVREVGAVDFRLSGKPPATIECQ